MGGRGRGGGGADQSPPPAAASGAPLMGGVRLVIFGLNDGIHHGAEGLRGGSGGYQALNLHSIFVRSGEEGRG